MNTADTITSMPATAPMNTAVNAPTNAQGAVIATSPASIPLHSMLRSGLPNTSLV
jgi:hypothetical protein